MSCGSSKAGTGYVREFVVDVVTETGSVDDGQGNTNAVLLKLYVSLLAGVGWKEQVGVHVPTLTGLILMPSST